VAHTGPRLPSGTWRGAAASPDHPHIVAVQAAGEDDDQLRLTMRYVDGAVTRIRVG
jgi:hypothetical protein